MSAANTSSTMPAVDSLNQLTSANCYQQPGPYNLTTTYNCCIGNTHSWACDHATTCRCGKARREVPTCACCGK